VTHKEITFRAAILVESESPLVIEEVAWNGPLGEGQVLVKVEFAGICGKQLEEIDAHFGPDPYLPHLLGHEGAGEVIAVGDGVSKVSPTDSVIMHWMKGSGIESALPKYSWRGKPLNAGLITTFNQYAVVSENRVTKLTEDLRLDHACLLGCGLSTGLGVVLNEAKVNRSQRVVVWGAGGVGLAAIQACRWVGVEEIVVIGRSELALEKAAANGATSTFDCSRDGWQSRLSEKHPNGFDRGLVCVGYPRPLEELHKFMAAPSELFMVGVPSPSATANIDVLAIHQRKALMGSYGGGIRPDVDLPSYVRMIKTNQVVVKDFVGPTVSLDNINEGIDVTKKGGAGRVLVKLWS
jgi:S-(hydroxymethyl)glutathione dehydrogenase/alcohol dehydrogenase